MIAALASIGTALAGPPTIVYSEDFAGCSDGGYALSGLWHAVLLSDCTPLQPGCGLYFGLDSPDCDFDTGSAVAGNADSPVIARSSSATR